VSLEMRPEQVSLESGKRLRGDYLFVNVDKDMADQWDAVPIGVEVEFTARISKQAGPFPGIAISAADDESGGRLDGRRIRRKAAVASFFPCSRVPGACPT
jgi:hypothetical protein